MKFKKGSKVQWKWLGRNINGVVLEAFTKTVEREIKGKKIKRLGRPEKPAYLVKSEAGNEALKLETELAELTKSKTVARRPKMFQP